MTSLNVVFIQSGPVALRSLAPGRALSPRYRSAWRAVSWWLTQSWGCEPRLSRPGEAQGFSQLGWLPLAMAGSPGRALPSRLLWRAAHPSVWTRPLGFVAQRPIYCWGFSASHAKVSLPVKWGNLIYPPATCPSACGVL